MKIESPLTPISPSYRPDYSGYAHVTEGSGSGTSFVPLAAQDIAQVYEVPVHVKTQLKTEPEPENPLEDRPAVVNRVRNAPQEVVVSSNKRARVAPVASTLGETANRVNKTARKPVSITALMKIVNKGKAPVRAADIPGVEVGQPMVEPGSTGLFEHLDMEDLRRAPKTAKKRKAGVGEDEVEDLFGVA